MSELPRTLVITGGTSGLGLEVVKLFVDKGYHVWLLSHSQSRIDDAIQGVLRSNPDGVVHGVEVDLGSLDSVRQAVAQMKSRISVVDVLLCNAAVWDAEPLSTVDGVEHMFAVNHLGHFVLVHELLPFVPSHGHIGVVSCGDSSARRRLGIPPAQYTTGSDLAKPITGNEYSLQAQRYSDSKLCNRLFVEQLSVWLQSTHRSSVYNPIWVWSIDPGVVPGTSLLRHQSWTTRVLMGTLHRVFGRWLLGVTTASQAAQQIWSIVEVELDVDTATLSARHFRNGQSTSLLDASMQEAREDVWKTSVELSGLSL